LGTKLLGDAPVMKGRKLYHLLPFINGMFYITYL